ncbi:hypothetical protein MSAN_00677000 [Mycena sanguinolenta]|uniref:Uncharacterized protein n=1 Tax=Mycena sanguinolenta TaxID=230812 RepID=A0A8H7DFM6_9AGAR|nr:hypothetical protein MSAN_00677000 [Mycena sanguinolenta]
MSSISEASFATLAPNSTSTPWGLLIGIVGVAIYYASPMRLTGILVAAMADTEKTYLAAVENGVICASTDTDITERLSVLQLEVSVIRETSLRISLSLVSALYDSFNIRRTVAILRHLHEVHRLGTYIQISNESQLREIDSRRPLPTRASISLRRRNCPGCV